MEIWKKIWVGVFFLNTVYIFLCTVQAYAMVERIGYPESILNDTELDAMYEEVNVYSIFDCRLFIFEYDILSFLNPFCSWLIVCPVLLQLEFNRSQYFRNVMNVDKHDSMRDIKRLRKPIDKDKYVNRR